MPRTCTICSHIQRPDIDRALVDGQAFRNIAQQYGTSATALTRHKRDHLPTHLATAKAAETEANADTLLDQIRDLQRRAISLLTKAEAQGDFRTALSGIREARACIETLLEVEGELDRRDTINITISPQWLEIRSVLFATLATYPEARIAVASALGQLNGGQHVDAA